MNRVSDPDGTNVLAGAGHLIRGLLRFLTRLVCWLLVVPLVLLPWLVTTLARVDPLGQSDSWARTDAPGAARSRRAGAHRRSRVERFRLGLSCLVVGALFVVPSSVVVLRFDDGAPPVPAAFEGAEWYPEYFEDMNWVMYSHAYNPTAALRVRDVKTRHVNVRSGRRATWAPPPCGECVRLRVWIYGGSTTFGLGQRDEHTIASALARAAWEDGIALDVENRGVGGDTHWEEAQRFAWDVTGEVAPDLVVFYDGTNEIMATRFSADADVAPSVIPAQLWTEYLERVPVDAVPPPGSGPTKEPVAGGSADEMGRLVARRYEHARWLSRTTAEGVGTPAVWAWQPVAERRDPATGEAEIEGREWALERLAAARAALGSDVIDLSEVYDDVDQRLFYDGIHTNELGADIAGRELYSRIRVEIRELAMPPTEDP